MVVTAFYHCYRIVIECEDDIITYWLIICYEFVLKHVISLISVLKQLQNCSITILPENDFLRLKLDSSNLNPWGTYFSLSFSNLSNSNTFGNTNNTYHIEVL